MATRTKLDLDHVAASIVGLFPTLDLLERRLSLQLYRLLAEGKPVAPAALAQRLGIPVETANQILENWPGVSSDAQGRVVGYWGLSTSAAYASPHRLMIEGRRLSAWCAWDTLFLPQLLGRIAEIESTDPVTDAGVRLTVAPEKVEYVDPPGAHMSFLVPDAAKVQKDVLSTFCHFVHFFPSRQIAEGWTARHAGTFVLSIGEAHAVARRKNEAQYRQVL
jgi:alkylmercury lyase